jgi:hypothetical protein
MESSKKIKYYNENFQLNKPSETSYGMRMKYMSILSKYVMRYGHYLRFEHVKNEKDVRLGSSFQMKIFQENKIKTNFYFRNKSKIFFIAFLIDSMQIKSTNFLFIL